jgi:ClpP class serine protease
MYADYAPFSDEERAKIRADIGTGYAGFKDRVAQGRNLSPEQVEAIARGRVWTGEQAQARGLVDTLGDLQDAADRARQLAGIPAARHAALVDVSMPKGYHLAEPAPVDPGAWLDSFCSLLREGVYALAPWSIRVRN